MITMRDGLLWIYKMNEKILSALRNTRTALQVLAEPIDAFDRFLNCKKGYPPLRIRQKVGSLNDFEGSGGEYIAYLKLLCALKMGDSMLDIGCGCGLMCLRINENETLPDYLRPGQYWGVDLDIDLIRWCRKSIRESNVKFEWLPNGSPYDMLFGSKRFDVILAKSLFTHLLPSETQDYLGELKRSLKPEGRCLTTFFLMNEVEPQGRYTFKHLGSTNAYYLERPSKPEAAVAYNEDWLLSKLKALEFSVDVYYGSWRGNKKGLSFQDIVVLRR